VQLLDPSPAACRAAVRGFAGRHAGLVDEDLEALVFAANEAVTNARVHGRRPVRMRLWTRRTRVVVTVTDAGQGPEDCLVGLLPSPTGGGLWLSEQLVEIAHRRHQEGYTVRLTTAVGGYGARDSQRTPKGDR
jgi:anti-sigma regulatory factor (Ser/Thr protein kinase)